MKAFVCGCRGPRLGADERAHLLSSDPFGLILFKRNVETREQLSALTSEFRDVVGRYAPVFVDQEGGRVQRLAPPVWRAYPAAARFLAELGRERALEAAGLVARLVARDLLEVGIDVDCAPVLDVADEATHQVIGSRAYGRNASEVAELGRAVVDGLLAGGVLPVIKHMPGHGRARVDSHLELPRVEASRAELAARDFAPFAALADAPAAMTAHIVFTALDASAPATQSKRVVDEIIRGEIGFPGLLISDDLSMKALAGDFLARTRAVFEAGVDLALHCNGDLAEARAVADATPELAGRALQRAEAALARIAGGPAPFDAEAAAARLEEIWPNVGASV